MEFLNQRLRKNQSELNIPLVSSVLTEVLAHCILVAVIKIIKKKTADPPDAPGIPRGIETTEDSITITWARPRHDGGSPITGYVIERRLISEDKWIKANHIHVPDTTYRSVICFFRTKWWL